MAYTVVEDETSRLISAGKVEGTDVYNTDGDHLGQIEKILIDKPSGKVAYAVMSFGGFLGIGEKYHPLPWPALKYDTRQGGYVVGIPKATLEDAPTIGPEERVDWADEAWGKRVHGHYGVAPYWI